MTRVCLVGADDARLPEDLLSYPTARDALDPFELEAPYDNTITVETISIGAAVSLLNDLDWYLVRLVEEALVLEPSVSETEWLSRKLATEVRNETVEPEETGTYLKIYGVVRDGGDGAGDESLDTAGDVDATGEGAAVGQDEAPGGTAAVGGGDGSTNSSTDAPGEGGSLRLAEPLFAQRVDGEVPEYDLREVEDTLVVRVTAREFGA